MSQRLCWKGYASILRLLQQQPRTYGDISEAMGCGLNNCRRIVNKMHDLRLVHVAGWVKRRTRGAHQALWGYGAGVDAPIPAGLVKSGYARSAGAYGTHRPELIAFAQIIRALADPVTRAELVEISGSTSCNISLLMRHCKEISLVRVAAWDSSKPGAPAEALQLGEGRSASRPRPMTREEAQRRCRQARKARAQALAITSALMARPAVSAALHPGELEAA